ncbi:MAG: hypothetical protein HY830_13250 [Actinobacteria bacterium]|nr:hypothetical protein [Actinomycetota bacterium]
MSLVAPIWSTWQPQIDSAGLIPGLSIEPASDGLVMTAGFSTPFLAAGDGQPLASVAAFGGSFSIEMTDDFPLAGFMLLVRGDLTKTKGSSVSLTCSVGQGVHTRHWPMSKASSSPGRGDRRRDEPADPTDFVTVDDPLDVNDFFSIECFASDFHPSLVGAPPYPAFPPLPVTLTAQARCRADFDHVRLDIINIDIKVLLEPRLG